MSCVLIGRAPEAGGRHWLRARRSPPPLVRPPAPYFQQRRRWWRRIPVWSRRRDARWACGRMEGGRHGGMDAWMDARYPARCPILRTVLCRDGWFFCVFFYFIVFFNNYFCTARPGGRWAGAAPAQRRGQRRPHPARCSGDAALCAGASGSFPGQRRREGEGLDLGWALALFPAPGVPRDCCGCWVPAARPGAALPGTWRARSWRCGCLRLGNPGLHVLNCGK